jgi:hypothetical protein
MSDLFSFGGFLVLQRLCPATGSAPHLPARRQLRQKQSSLLLVLLLITVVLLLVLLLLLLVQLLLLLLVLLTVCQLQTLTMLPADAF